MDQDIVKNTFDYLVVGISEGLDNNFAFPYPAPMKYALDRLACLMPLAQKAFPFSFPDILTMFKQPLRHWWPGDLPEEIDPRFSLINEQNELDEQIEDYLFECDLKMALGSSIFHIRSIVDQKDIANMVVRARSGSNDIAQQYVIARKFLIENPWIHGRFESLPTDLITFRDVVTRSYGNVPKVALHNGSYWICPYCRGILIWEENRPRCVKPSICARQNPDYAGMLPLQPSSEILCLKKSIHSRVCMPGLPELKLYQAIQDQISTGRSGIKQVSLWPNADAYDIRIEFQDSSAWAIDLKDYSNPIALAKKIQGKEIPDSDHPIFGWNKGFYVIPDYRENFHPGYLMKVRELFKRNRPAGTEVILSSGLMKRLHSKIKKH